MNFVLVTPASQSSAIATTSDLLKLHLEKLGHRVGVVCSEAEGQLESRRQDFAGNAVNWDDYIRVPKIMTSNDMIIYQIGNYYDYHKGVLELMQKYPGIVIFHDYMLTNLFLDFCKLTSSAEKSQVIDDCYGEGATKHFEQMVHNKNYISIAAKDFPMTEWIARSALGSLVHSDIANDRFLRSCPGPIAVTPLLYKTTLPYDGKPKLSSQSNKHTLLTFGHINVNKRCKSIITALGKNPSLAKQWSYRLVGFVEERQRKILQEHANKLGVEISFTGQVSNEVLHHEINNADLVSCLRFPVLEMASASTIEAMLYGKVTMVSNVSHYKNLPDTVAIKIDISNEIDDLQRVLQKFCDDPLKHQSYGVQARAWVKQTHDPASYAATVVELAVQVKKLEEGRKLVSGINVQLQKWGVSADSSFIARTAEPLNIFFE